MSMATSTVVAMDLSAQRGLDSDSRDWLDALRDDGPRRDAAIDRLHALLLRATRFEVGRRKASLPHLRGGSFDDLATQSADDALVAVLAKLDEFRGASRFSTWAYKFALLEAAVRLRRLSWQDREVPLEPASWDVFAAARASPHDDAETAELLSALRIAIDDRLTPRQREVLVAITLTGVPIDVLAERLNTTRGALYKTLHDARQKLRRCLADQGLDIEGVAG
jgi:RNA polymerase sigma-70 factor (ECF subfamily)